MTETNTREVTLTRYFDAPPELVYRAFTDREQLSQWLGPLMFTVPVDTVDLDVRPGGHWRATMVGKDNPEWRPQVDMTLTEVVENPLIVGYEVSQGVPGIEDGTQLWLSLELSPEGDGTRLELRQGPLTKASTEMVEVGWFQAFHKLDALLETPAKFRNSPTNNEESA